MHELGGDGALARALKEAAVRDNWRTYLSFILVGAIFIACQALSAGSPGTPSNSPSAEGPDSSHRDGSRLETTGRGN